MVTSCPASESLSQTWEPRNPAPPKKVIFIVLHPFGAVPHAARGRGGPLRIGGAVRAVWIRLLVRCVGPWPGGVLPFCQREFLTQGFRPLARKTRSP